MSMPFRPIRSVFGPKRSTKSSAIVGLPRPIMRVIAISVSFNRKSIVKSFMRSGLVIKPLSPKILETIHDIACKILMEGIATPCCRRVWVVFPPWT
jgi:hypothetical protein